MIKVTDFTNETNLLDKGVYMIKHSSLYKVLKDQNLDNYSYIKKFIETIKNEH